MEPLQFGTAIRIRYPEKLTETYVRSWRERLFSRPWRPWTRIGTREITFSLMQKRMRDTQEAMRAAYDTRLYS